MTVAAALCSLVACSEEQPRLAVAADSAVFGRGSVSAPAPMANVTFAVSNRAGPTGFVPACGQKPTVTVEQAVQGGWTQYAGGYCLTIVPEAPLEVFGGTRLAGNVWIADPGRYRLRLDYATGADFAKTFSTVSAPFEVR
ncbi:MAG: hypothetical protein ACJ79K_12045 [Gemmatimonadaceae bacterium]